jgi:hypothetical protein
VKNKPPTIKDIVQTKVYAEASSAPYAFLISFKAIIEEIRRFLSKRYLLLSYGAYRKVYIGRFNISSGLVEDTDWYPENPFKSD